VAFVGEDSERVRVLSYFVNASERDSYPCAAICDCGAAVILNMCFADSDGLVDLVYVAGTQPVTHAVRKYIGGRHICERCDTALPPSASLADKRIANTPSMSHLRGGFSGELPNADVSPCPARTLDR